MTLLALVLLAFAAVCCVGLRLLVAAHRQASLISRGGREKPPADAGEEEGCTLPLAGAGEAPLSAQFTPPRFAPAPSVPAELLPDGSLDERRSRIAESGSSTAVPPDMLEETPVPEGKALGKRNPLPERHMREGEIAITEAAFWADPIDGVPFSSEEQVFVCRCGTAYRAESRDWLAEHYAGRCVHCDGDIEYQKPATVGSSIPAIRQDDP